MKSLKLKFCLNWLVLGGMVTVDSLKIGLKLAKKHGVTALELPWEPLMTVPASVLAELLRIFGIKEVAICCFFGKGGIDPLSKNGREYALLSLERAARRADELRNLGIRIIGIDGPWAYQIAKNYEQKGFRKRLISFCNAVAKIGRKYSIVFFLECLREEENTAMRGSYELLEVLKAVNDAHVLGHLDTFHMQLWDEDIPVVLANFGDRLGWFHCSGTARRTPGRLGDTVKWKEVSFGLWLNRKEGGALECVCFEGFSPEFRKLVPEIGGEFPRDLPPDKSIALAKKTLKQAKIIK